MAARTYTLLTHSRVRDHGWSLHKPGCVGIDRDVLEHGSTVEPDVVIDLDDEDAMMRAIDVDGLGYSPMDVKVHACCDTAPLAPAEPAVEVVDCGDTSAHEPHDGTRARPNGRPGGLDMTPIHCPGRTDAGDGLDLDRVVPLEEALAGAEAKRQARRAGWMAALGGTNTPMDTRTWGAR